MEQTVANGPRGAWRNRVAPAGLTEAGWSPYPFLLFT
jgi:hypothetical protein